MKKSWILRCILIAVLLALGIPAGANASDSPTVAALDEAKNTNAAASPFQKTFQENISQRQAAGLPVPASVVYEYQVTPQPGASGQTLNKAIPGQPIKIVAKTVVTFENPQQAGYAQWPALVIKNKLPAGVKGKIKEGDYTQRYYRTMEKEIPGIWQKYRFGQEPRTQTFVETYEIAYPKVNLMLPGNPVGELATANPLTGFSLMGFTYSGPHLDYAIEQSSIVCDPFGWGICKTIYEFKAGFELDWALGLRLPTQTMMTGATETLQSGSYDLSAALTPLDWEAEDYESVGVAPEDGNEFVLRLVFFAGVKAYILDANICPLVMGCYEEISIDQSTSFMTPFGTDAYFPIPAANIPVKEWDFELFSFEVGLGIQPNLGSSQITANWEGLPESGCVGSGQVAFSEAGEPVTFGPVTACGDNQDQAKIRLSGFRYWFNTFLIELNATLSFNLLGYGVWNPEVTITEIDLSLLTDDMYLTAHQQCDWAFHCGPAGPADKMDLSILVTDKNAPTSSIALSGTEGNNGWYRSDVQVTLTAEDNPPGSSGAVKIEYSFDGEAWNEYSAPFMVHTEGFNAFFYRATDLEGNTEVAKVEYIKIDRTAPILSGSPTTLASSYGWHNTDVIIHFTGSDSFSGIDTITPDQIITLEGNDQSVTGTATDVAGNSVSVVVEGIDIDKTLPAVTIANPTSTTYANTANLTANWTASDGLSGIATETGQMDGMLIGNGQSVNLLLMSPGSHTFNVQAVDKAGNVNYASVQFTVTTDIDGLIAATRHVCKLGWITKAGICNSLQAKLKAVKSALVRGQEQRAIQQLRAFTQQLNAQYHKAVSESAYLLLKSDALYVIDQIDQ